MKTNSMSFLFANATMYLRLHQVKFAEVKTAKWCCLSDHITSNSTNFTWCILKPVKFEKKEDSLNLFLPLRTDSMSLLFATGNHQLWIVLLLVFIRFWATLILAVVTYPFFFLQTVKNKLCGSVTGLALSILW